MLNKIKNFFKENIINNYKIDVNLKNKELLKNKPEIVYFLKNTQLGKLAFIELNHVMINLPYIISKINLYDKEIKVDVTNFNTANIYLDNNNCITLNNNYLIKIEEDIFFSENIFDKNTEFDGKDKIESFFNFIKKEIIKDLDFMKLN